MGVCWLKALLTPPLGFLGHDLTTLKEPDNSRVSLAYVSKRAAAFFASLALTDPPSLSMGSQELLRFAGGRILWSFNRRRDLGGALVS
jgi:hypothetical protein